MMSKRREQYKNLIRFGLSFIIWILVSTAWAYTWMENFANIIMRPFGYKGNWLVFAMYAVLLFVFTSFYGGYKIGYYRREDIMFSSVLALIFTNAITYLQASLIGRALLPVAPFLLMTSIQAVVSSLWAYMANGLYIKMFSPHKMLLIYSGKNIARSLIHKMVSRAEKYTIKEVVCIDSGLEAVLEKIDSYKAVVICDIPSEQRNMILKYCFANSIRTYTTPKISDILMRGATSITLFDTPLMLNRNYGLSFEQRFVKRTIDLVLSAIALVITSPFMLLTAIAIKLYDRGPVLFKQLRCTLDERQFYVIKFRSMIVDAEKNGKSRPAIDGDPRITPIGRFIRATRLDELPQLFNILRGDMSIVGPRPERIEHVQKYTAEIPEFTFRHKVKGGLTGYAQIVGRYNTSAYDKLKMDLMYIANYSLIEDFRLIMMTIKIMFVKSSTEGFVLPNSDAPADESNPANP